MVPLVTLRCSPPPSKPQSMIGFRHRPTTTVLAIGANLPSPPNFRLKNAIRLQVRQSLSSVFASNANPSDRDSLTEKTDGINTTDDSQGPPLLTILAGFVVFFLVCWVIGSIIMWLVGLIVHFPPSK